MAAGEPRQRHPPARPQAEAIERLVGVGRAGGQVTAIESDQGREGMAIELDQAARGERRRAREPRHKVPIRSR